MAWLKEHGSEQTRKVLRRHGARDPFYGVKVADLKKMLKGHRNDHRLAMQLWESGNSDAMYLAVLMANSAEASPELLRAWMRDAYWYMLSESGVAGLAAEGPHGWALGREWIESDDEIIAAGGWATLSSWLSLHSDNDLDIPAIRAHTQHIASTIHRQPNRVRYGMNNYIICAAVYVRELHQEALRIAQTIGLVTVDMAGTSCKTPYAPQYIEKIARMGRIGRKRTHARC